MTTRHEVTCAHPDSTDIDRRIDAIGGPDGGGWWMDIDTAIVGLDTNQFTLFVREPGLLDLIAEVVVKEGVFRRYLATVRDGVETNNLQNLPQCPATYRRVT